MDQEIRNKLRNVVTQCRKLLEEDTRDALEGKYGIFAKKDQVTADPNAKMTHLTEEEQAARKDILDHFGHIKARGFKAKEALDQMVREIAFTHLNRLCAYKMMEAREVFVGGQKFREAVSRGINSNGVKFYLADHPDEERLFNTGHQDVAYRHFLDWLGAALSEEIGVLFNPNDPANRLYPRQKTLDEVLELLNNGGIKTEETALREQWPLIWSQDETIGWVYQYFTPKELRDQARKESSAPRNSYELAFRNQFFTPRYVVEFLTDNTLGRIWYEMRKGDTKLKDQCRYMVRRPKEVFLDDPDQFLPEECRSWVRKVRSGDFSDLPNDPTEMELASVSLAFDGYKTAERLGGYGDLLLWWHEQLDEFNRTGKLPKSSLDLWLILFTFQRGWKLTGDRHGDDFLRLWRQVYVAWRDAMRPADDLSQTELLDQPVYVPHRHPKDPRDLKVLDPACGSGHFLLYCFDLLTAIYEEAWECGGIECADFGLRNAPKVVPESVRFNPQAKLKSNYSSKPLAPEKAFVVIAVEPDSGDGVLARTPYLVDAATRFRVPFALRVPAAEFSYAQSLAKGLFTPEGGAEFLHETGAFVFDGVPVLAAEAARDNFRRQIPGMILAHNLHGIDIDLRASQIAALALWLRCQRAYQDMGLKKDRPKITRSNFVCAEPMPGEQQMLKEFVGQLEPKLLGQVVEVVFDKMKLAGGAGSFLKIEEEIRDAVAGAKKQYVRETTQAMDRKGQPLLFPQTTMRLAGKPEQPSLFDLSDITDNQFFEEAESRVIEALRSYAEKAQNGHRLQRRLFTEDAVRGFAFIDLCRHRYDVVLMNPPRLATISRTFG